MKLELHTTQLKCGCFLHEAIDASLPNHFSSPTRHVLEYSRFVECSACKIARLKQFSKRLSITKAANLYWTQKDTSEPV